MKAIEARSTVVTMVVLALAVPILSTLLQAQEPSVPAKSAATAATPPTAVPMAPDYTFGPDDAFSVVFWKEPDMSADVVVRPDGKISLPLINEIQALGLTPEQLRTQVTELAAKFVEAPNVTIVVKQVNSRKVFITGNVARPGPYPLAGPMTVLHLIATSGGLSEYADVKNVLIMRTENGKALAIKFNYEEITKGKNLDQNIALRAGDTVLVP